jgi:hypothetical protein
MSPGGWVAAGLLVLTVAVLALLGASMVRSIRDERSARRSLWREFGLSIVLLALFLGSWVGQLASQWQVYTDEQAAHGESTSAGDFVPEFMASTFENWQSEFLQLFSFAVLAALFIHKGSAESKDGEERLEASLRRIEEHLGTLPMAPAPPGTDWRLPDTQLEAED